MRAFLLVGFVSWLAGCGGTMVEPGHRLVVFDPADRQRPSQVLAPGYYYSFSSSAHVQDFDVTYSTRKETLHVVTSEGLALEIQASVIYRPIIEELAQLENEVGPEYGDELVAPEFRSATLACFARHGFADLLGAKESIEDEIEGDVRRRLAGKHIEISSATLEGVTLPPELANAVRDRLVAEQNATREKLERESAQLRDSDRR